MCRCEIQRITLGGDVELGEGHEEKAAEGCAKKGAVDGLETAVRWGVDIEAGWAEQLDGFLAGYVVAPHR